MKALVPFAWGAISMGCLVAALFFVRFYRQSRDRLFVLFALAFVLLGVNWLVLAASGDWTAEAREWIYAARLVAFLLIIVAIVDKNRAPR